MCTLNVKARGFQPGGQKKSRQGGLDFRKFEYWNIYSFKFRGQSNLSVGNSFVQLLYTSSLHICSEVFKSSFKQMIYDWPKSMDPGQGVVLHK